MKLAIGNYKPSGDHVARVMASMMGGLRAAGAEFEDWLPYASSPVLPQARAVIHLADPAEAQPAPGKANVLLWGRTRAGALDMGEVARLSQFDVILTWSPDQMHQARAATAPFGRIVGMIEPAPAPRFDLCNPERPLLRVPGRPLRFLWIARQKPEAWKFVLMAWRAAFTPTFFADVALTIAGGHAPIPESIVDQGGAVTVNHAAHVWDPDWAALYEAHDVVICDQTDGYGMGVPALEAQAAGCLLVGPSAGTLAGAITDGTAAVAPVDENGGCSAQDFGALLRRVNEAWGTSTLEPLRQNGIAKARERSWVQIGKTVLGIVRDIAYNGMRRVG